MKAVEFGLRPPASPSCGLYEPEDIGAYAYPPACKPYRLCGLAWPQDRSGSILRLAEKQPRWECRIRPPAHRALCLRPGGKEGRNT